MKCKERQIGEPPCKEQATLKVPTGYGRDDLMCPRHGSVWARAHRKHFERMAIFYQEIDS